MAHRSVGQALCGTRRRAQVRATIPLQQSFANVRKIQRYFQEKNRTERRRKSSAALWCGGQGDRSSPRGETQRRAGSGIRGGRVQDISHDVFRAGARNGEGRPVVPGVRAGQAEGGRGDGKAVALQLQRVRAEENERTAKAEEVPRRRIRRGSGRRPGQTESACEVLKS